MKRTDRPTINGNGYELMGHQQQTVWDYRNVTEYCSGWLCSLHLLLTLLLVVNADKTARLGAIHQTHPTLVAVPLLTSFPIYYILQ